MNCRANGCLAIFVVLILLASSGDAAIEDPPTGGLTIPVDGAPDLEPPPRNDDPICAAHAVIHNRANQSLKFLYSWLEKSAIPYQIKAKDDTEVKPIYCSSKLTIITDGQQFSINLKANQDYDLIWDPLIKQFVFIPNQKSEHPTLPKGEQPDSAPPPR
jgi:hypothetical protein